MIKPGMEVKFVDMMAVFVCHFLSAYMHILTVPFVVSLLHSLNLHVEPAIYISIHIF